MNKCTMLRILFLISLAFGPALPAQPARPPYTKADFENSMKELSNWGRWGTTDELGALNLITPEKRLSAAKLVREGIPISLSHDAEKEIAADNPRPFVHQMLSTSATPGAQSHSDSFTVAHHGLAHTHLDALCHFFYDGKMYNGFAREEVTAKGAGKLSVYAARNGIFTRAVLMDIPRLKGLPYLEPGTPIYPEDLDAWEKMAGLRVQPGRRSDPHGALGAPCGKRAVVRKLRRAARHVRTLAQESRRRRAGQRCRSGCVAVRGRGRQPAHPPAGARRDGDANPGQLRFGGTKPRRAGAEAMGLPDHHVAARRSRRDRFGAQSDCGFLKRSAGRWSQDLVSPTL